MFLHLNESELDELTAALSVEIWRKKQAIKPNDKEADKKIIKLEKLYNKLDKKRRTAKEN